MRTEKVHLTAALVAAALALAAVAGGNAVAQQIMAEYVHAAAPLKIDVKRQGSALQRAAFLSPDLLPIYGSSELDFPNPYHANRIFRLYPTGFAVFPVGGTAAGPLITLQRLAAVGPALRGKKVVISMSPDFFIQRMSPPDAYDYNNSALHSNALIFSADLSWSLKRAAAIRMLDYPEVLPTDPLLKFALESLADASPAAIVRYYAALPLGQLHLQILYLQDDWETAKVIRERNDLDPNTLRVAKGLDWASLLAQAEQETELTSSNNEFGFDDDIWNYFEAMYVNMKGSLPDKRYLGAVGRSKGWQDLGLLLRGLQEMGAQPLIINIPYAGRFYDYQGVSEASRHVAFYQRLVDTVKPFGFPVVTMEEHDSDPFFHRDSGAHLSAKGWIFYAESLDAFYHGALY